VSASTVPAAANYLLSSISALTNVDGAEILVKIGEQSPNAPPDIILITSVRRTVIPHTLIGSYGDGALKETYTQVVECSTFSPYGDTEDFSTVSAAVNERVWQLVTYVESAVRTDPTFGATVINAYPGESTTEGVIWTPEGLTGLLALVEVPIHIEAEI
jgi:hypothetical protein